MFGMFEIGGNVVKSRVRPDLEFADVDAALAHFGDAVVCCEVSLDGEFADLFLASGNVYSVERIA